MMRKFLTRVILLSLDRKRIQSYLFSAPPSITYQITCYAVRFPFIRTCFHMYVYYYHLIIKKIILFTKSIRDGIVRKSSSECANYNIFLKYSFMSTLKINKIHFLYLELVFFSQCIIWVKLF